MTIITAELYIYNIWVPQNKILPLKYTEIDTHLKYLISFQEPA